MQGLWPFLLLATITISPKTHGASPEETPEPPKKTEHAKDGEATEKTNDPLTPSAQGDWTTPFSEEQLSRWLDARGELGMAVLDQDLATLRAKLTNGGSGAAEVGRNLQTLERLIEKRNTSARDLRAVMREAGIPFSTGLLPGTEIYKKYDAIASTLTSDESPNGKYFEIGKHVKWVAERRELLNGASTASTTAEADSLVLIESQLKTLQRIAELESTWTPVPLRGPDFQRLDRRREIAAEYGKLLQPTNFAARKLDPTQTRVGKFRAEADAALQEAIETEFDVANLWKRNVDKAPQPLDGRKIADWMLGIDPERFKLAILEGSISENAVTAAQNALLQTRPLSAAQTELLQRLKTASEPPQRGESAGSGGKSWYGWYQEYQKHAYPGLPEIPGGTFQVSDAAPVPLPAPAPVAPVPVPIPVIPEAPPTAEEVLAKAQAGLTIKMVDEGVTVFQGVKARAEDLKQYDAIAALLSAEKPPQTYEYFQIADKLAWIEARRAELKNETSQAAKAEVTALNQIKGLLTNLQEIATLKGWNPSDPPEGKNLARVERAEKLVTAYQNLPGKTIAQRERNARWLADARKERDRTRYEVLGAEPELTYRSSPSSENPRTFPRVPSASVYWGGVVSPPIQIPRTYLPPTPNYGNPIRSPGLNAQPISRYWSNSPVVIHRAPASHAPTWRERRLLRSLPRQRIFPFRRRALTRGIRQTGKR